MLKKLRNRKFILLCSLFMLVFSCSQYEIANNKSFDYTAFEEFQKSNLNIFNINSINSIQNKSNLELRRDILNQINQDLETNIDLSDEFLELHDLDYEQMETILLRDKLVNHIDIGLL